MGGLILCGMVLAGRLDALMVEIPLPQLAREADLIIVGRVESVKAHKRGGMIISVASLRVVQVLKGRARPQARITVEFEGGRVGEEILTVEDTPDYEPGEEVVAFLEQPPGTGIYKTVGMFQGKYVIQEGLVQREHLTLEAFLQKIETLVREGKP